MKKNLKDLEGKLAEQADCNVQAKIKLFKDELDAALTKLCGNGNSGFERFGLYGAAGEGTRINNPNNLVANVKREILQLAICDKVSPESKTKAGWPCLLWKDEQNALQNELLAKMDLMQKLLLAKPRVCADDVPCAE